MTDDSKLPRQCGDGHRPAYGTLVVDFENLKMYRDGEQRWRAVVKVVEGDATALLGAGKTPAIALASLLGNVESYGARYAKP
jgi:hypothetical protein